MFGLTQTAMRWLADHHGVITTDALRRCGVGRSTVNRLVDAGVLRHVHKRVYVVSTAEPTLKQRCVILSGAHPSGFVTGPTAGVLLGARRMPRTLSLHFAVRHGLHLPPEPGVIFHQTRALEPRDRMVCRDGISVATPDRFAFDAGLVLSLLDHLSVVHQLLHEGRVTHASLRATESRLCHPARPGSTQFRDVLARLGAEPPAQSHPEVVLAEALRQRGVPVERQSEVFRAGGKVAHVDLAVPAVRWGIELDIHPEHRSIEGHVGDTRRYRSLHLVEWQIEPVSELDMADVPALADELAALFRTRGRLLHGCRSVS